MERCSGNTLIIAPSDISYGSLFTVQLPRSRKQFLVNATGLFAVQKVNYPGSALVDDVLSAETKLHICYPFDPVFLCMSWLFQKPKKFRSYAELLEEGGLAALLDCENLISRIEFCSYCFRFAQGDKIDWFVYTFYVMFSDLFKCVYTCQERLAEG